MADLSGLIYSTALANPIQEPNDPVDRPARQSAMTYPAGAAGRLAPLLSIVALSLGTIVLSARTSHVPVPVSVRSAQLSGVTALRVPPAELPGAWIGRGVPVEGMGR